MALYEINSENLTKIAQTTFDQTGLRERTDLQRLLKKQIEVISPDTLVITEEFGEWHESKRRIDLLGLDKDANLVVIELKRTEDGGHMELQAIRYAAMISTMTFEKVVEIYSRYLSKNGRVENEPKKAILEFLEWDEPNEELFAQDVRIVLVSANFSKELTSAVMWLNDRNLDIRCIRVIPYHDNERILIDVQQVIPLPEVAEYQIQIREKEQEGRKVKAERYSIRKKFWDSLLNLAETKTSLHSNISPSEYSWIGTGIGIRGLSYNYNVGQRDSRVELYIDRSEGEVNERIFDELIAHKEELENTFGQALSWQRLEGKRACRIAFELHNGGYRNDESDWEAIQIPMIDAMVQLEKALSPFITNLRAVR
jgi:hypothetical protein